MLFCQRLFDLGHNIEGKKWPPFQNHLVTRHDPFEMKQQVFVGASVIVAGCRQRVLLGVIYTPGCGKQTSLFISLLLMFLPQQVKFHSTSLVS